MKAVVFHEHGGLEQLHYEEIQDPVPGPDDVLVRVKACALNHLDIWVRQGIPAYKIPLPHVSGADIAGVSKPSVNAFPILHVDSVSLSHLGSAAGIVSSALLVATICARLTDWWVLRFTAAMPNWLRYRLGTCYRYLIPCHSQKVRRFLLCPSPPCTCYMSWPM